MKTIEKNVGAFVAEDYRTAAVFQKYGIDFCCKGNKTINEVCNNKHILVEDLLNDLTAVKKQGDNQNIDYQSWSLDLLADYIEKKHHRYIEETTPVLKQYLDKLCKVHGRNHHELFEIAEQFNAAVGELATHMKKEELILFPYIRKMVKSKGADENTLQPNFGTIKNPIKMMLQEHDIEGGRFMKISSLSNSYSVPIDACNTYRTAYLLLKEFEDDLHLHIHLENNILFPKSIELEERISQKRTKRSYETVSEAVTDLTKRGYTTDFPVLVEKECLVCNKTAKELSPDEFEIDETYRFEGSSDPGDEIIIFAISSKKYNMKGIVVNGYGVYSNSESSKIVSRLAQHL